MSIKDNLLQTGVKRLSEVLGDYLVSFKDPEMAKSLWEAPRSQTIGCRA